MEKLRTAKASFAYAAKRYVAKKDEIPELQHKPGRFWGVVGRKNLPFGKREVRDVSAKEAVRIRRTMRRYRWANTPPEKRKFLRKSQLWSQDFTAKLFCNVEFWLERLPKLIGHFENTAITIQNSELDPFKVARSPALRQLGDLGFNGGKILLHVVQASAEVV